MSEYQSFRPAAIFLACLFALALLSDCVIPTRPEPPDECEEEGPIPVDTQEFQAYLKHIEEGDTISFCEWLEER